MDEDVMSSFGDDGYFVGDTPGFSKVRFSIQTALWPCQFSPLRRGRFFSRGSEEVALAFRMVQQVADW